MFIGFRIVSCDVLVKIGDKRKFDYIEAKSDSSLVTCKEVRLKQISLGKYNKRRGKVI